MACNFSGWHLDLSPKMDLHESKEKNELTAIIELPGVNKEDVSVEILDGCLIISGERTVSKDLDKAGYAVRERRFGRFSRAIRLSPGVKVWVFLWSLRSYYYLSISSLEISMRKWKMVSLQWRFRYPSLRRSRRRLLFFNGYWIWRVILFLWVFVGTMDL